MQTKTRVGKGLTRSLLRPLVQLLEMEIPGQHQELIITIKTLKTIVIDPDGLEPSGVIKAVVHPGAKMELQVQDCNNNNNHQRQLVSEGILMLDRVSDLVLSVDWVVTITNGLETVVFIRHH